MNLFSHLIHVFLFLSALVVICVWGPEQLYLSSKFKLLYGSILVFMKRQDALEKDDRVPHRWMGQGTRANLVLSPDDPVCECQEGRPRLCCAPLSSLFAWCLLQGTEAAVSIC